ncbi:hypothetical protein [Longimicrobium terrae]|uniref:Uncharacterized protein n=1 Tax=Longimicrobium terrae TaxID=1639882 RepID=A0A841GVW3_9BACT|nr:hypothetical protein [Longimicrobium terrae]MBB4635331.1 hypothetical protein [Longimicrobium terrae]MBB6069724.1 hypothetical protein [Longimicrobium terrae]NNC31065.1 hypothetical protein [Longimicrobium terrae]
MPETFEERYADLLQNIEAAIVHVHRSDPELLDYDVDAALEALVSGYAAEKLGRAPKPLALAGRRLAVYEAVRHVCEWRLGREPFTAGEPALGDPVSVDDVLACCKRVRKSAERWTKQRGRQGYLTFVAQFLP